MIEVNGSQGVQIGDGNIQICLFTGEQPPGPVVVGNVPQIPPAFQSREDLLAPLRAPDPGVSIVHAVTGMRGVGKTQLAAAYARERVNAGWRLVAWVNAEDTSGMLNGLVAVADRLGISRPGTDLEVIGGEVRNRLEADGERCLIVYDNVTDPDALAPYIPSAGRSQVLVTSTYASVLSLGRPTKVEVFTEQESLGFLFERTNLDDADGAKILAEEVGYLPLALAQAAAVIQAQHLSYPVYLTRLRGHPTGKYLPAAKGSRYPRGVGEAIGLSIDTVTATDPSGLCGDLLAVISLLSTEGVARELLHRGERESAPDGRAAEIDEALARLADASLLTFSGGDKAEPNLIAHRLVMRVTRERRAHDGTLNAAGSAACELLAVAAESLGEPWRQRTAARALVRQIIALNDHIARQRGADDTGALAENLLSRRAWALWCLDELADNAALAVDLGEPLADDLERVLGESHPRTLTARNDLALAYRLAGRVGDAVALYERVLADRERVLGQSHPDTLTTRNDLAIAYAHRLTGRVEDAIGLHQRVLADRERVLGESDPETVTSRNNLALAYQAAGRAGDAVLLYERVLADRERLLGESHPDTLTSRNNLAGAYLLAAQVEDAVPLFERVLADRERVLGQSHPDTVMARNNLAGAYRVTGRLREAIGLFEASLAQFERVLGADHPSAALVRENLAAARRKAKDQETGERTVG
jgi:tetratricopeptide (TPR) repeat protein